MTESDQELLDRVGEKDHEAFRQLVEKHQEKVFRLCLGFLKNPQDAEDLAQDVFLSVYKNARRFRGDARVSTWMYRIAVNLCINRLRKESRLKRLISFGILSGSPELERIPGDADTPESLLEKRERREVLNRALERLPSNQRIAFTLHRIEGLSHEEVAEIMECSVSAVESRIHRAKLNLQKHLVDWARKKH
jgi:RNA polymerase sigma-70 factor (ECF subfamily)